MERSNVKLRCASYGLIKKVILWNGMENGWWKIKKSSLAYKPGPVFWYKIRTSIIYLLSFSQTRCIYLPTDIWACNSQRLCSLAPAYMVFQPTRFIPLLNRLRRPCALTAHFHPYPDESGRLFSATLSLFYFNRNQNKMLAVS